MSMFIKPSRQTFNSQVLGGKQMPSVAGCTIGAAAETPCCRDL